MDALREFRVTTVSIHPRKTSEGTRRGMNRLPHWASIACRFAKVAVCTFALLGATALGKDDQPAEVDSPAKVKLGTICP